MARPKKQVVDYFPHFVKAGRTIYILESLYGNDGYAFWFKLLEVLGESDGHYYDCGNSTNWAFLLAKTHVNDETAAKIIHTLIELGKIDKALWERRIIWVQNLVDHFADIYKKRASAMPAKPTISDAETPQEPTISDAETPQEPTISDAETPQSKVKQSKAKERKGKQIYPYQDIIALWNEVCVSLPQVKALNENRRKKIRCRLEEWGDSEKWLQTARELFSMVQESDFLSGRNGRWTSCSFDWLFANGENWVKVSEGNYINKGPRAGNQQQGGNSPMLGVDERIEADGRRTYGTGRATIPHDAPPRPSNGAYWDEASKQWIS